jgi:hypothetical protein
MGNDDITVLKAVSDVVSVSMILPRIYHDWEHLTDCQAIEYMQQRGTPMLS